MTNHGMTIQFSKPPIAFFSMEYGFDDEKNQYAGGLGILSADFVLEAGDQQIPYIAFGLRYADAVLSEHVQELMFPDGTTTRSIPIAGEHISFRCLVKKIGTQTYWCLLDTDIPQNTAAQRALCNKIYDADQDIFLKQQLLLGLGATAVLRTLNITPAVYHLNEGHTAFAALGLLIDTVHQQQVTVSDAFARLTNTIVATKHTILSAAGIKLDKQNFTKYLGEYCTQHTVSVDDIFLLEEGGIDDSIFSTTKFLIQMAGRQNGVSALHTVYEKKEHPESDLLAITNGVYQQRWQSALIRDTADIRTAKRILRGQLVDFIQQETGIMLSPDALTLVWARRFAKYKRPDLLFSIPDRLLSLIHNNTRPVQLIISGKAHPSDPFGLSVVQLVKDFIQRHGLESKIVYLPNYNPQTAHVLVAGADVWINTPERGMEACGTSGMKAGLNGTLQCSVSDGWVDEVDWNGIGWMLPDADTITTAQALFDVLEQEIIPSFYESVHDDTTTQGWAQRMQHTKDIVETRYTTKRMLRDYIRTLYKLEY